MTQPPNFNHLIAEHFGLGIPEGFQALPARNPHPCDGGLAAEKFDGMLVIGYVFTVSAAWGWEDFSDSKVYAFSNDEHRQSYVEVLEQDGKAHWLFYLNDSPHLVVLPDDDQARYLVEREAGGEQAAKAFLKRTGRRLQADYDRWTKRDIYGVVFETWEPWTEKGDLVRRTNCYSDQNFLGVEAAVEGLREEMACWTQKPRAAAQAVPGLGEAAAP